MAFAEHVLDALSSIHRSRVVHPIVGLQERPLCYELYFRLRCLELAKRELFGPAMTQAELNKHGQHHFGNYLKSFCEANEEILDYKVREAMPDILIHEPGTNDHNKIVVEVKRAGSATGDIQWDFTKLALFSDGELSYSERLFILVHQHNQKPGHWQEVLQKLATSDGPEIKVAIYDIDSRDFIKVSLHYSVTAAQKYLRENPPPKRVKKEEAYH